MTEETVSTTQGDGKVSHKHRHRQDRGANATLFDIFSIIVSIAGAVYTLLPWGVFQSRLAELDTGLMVTAGFIFVAALIAYIGTVAQKKTNGTRNKATALTARILIWLSILGFIVPIFIRFLTELLNM